MACTSNRRNAASTLGKWNRTQRGESRINGMRFSLIQLSMQRSETETAFATTRFVTRPRTSAAVPVAGRDSPGAFLQVGAFMCGSFRTPRTYSERGLRGTLRNLFLFFGGCLSSRRPIGCGQQPLCESLCLLTCFSPTGFLTIERSIIQRELV